ncbi:MAG: hypothetical protein NTY48_01100 [Candidatus Diapherotrites archaeon]|nr:hypothetical protein [Candidatus Diapherotrites archaeon]
MCIKSIRKAGSENKLVEEIKIPASTFYYYKNALYQFPTSRFKALLDYLGLKDSDIKFELVDGNDSRRAGGNEVYKKYVCEGRFDEIHSKMRVASSKRMSKWHSEMKLFDKKRYCELQYSRFKKITGYLIETTRAVLPQVVIKGQFLGLGAFYMPQ